MRFWVPLGATGGSSASVPAGMTIDPNLGRLTWNPTIAQIGTYPITVIVTNSGGLAATQSYNLIVAADTQAPNVSSATVPASQVGMGQSFTFSAIVGGQ